MHYIVEPWTAEVWKVYSRILHRKQFFTYRLTLARTIDSVMEHTLVQKLAIRVDT